MHRHLYVNRVEAGPDRVLAELTAAGIGAGMHGPDPWHLMPGYAHFGYGRGTCQVAEQAAEILPLPMFPHLTEVQQELVTAALRTAVANG